MEFTEKKALADIRNYANRITFGNELRSVIKKAGFSLEKFSDHSKIYIHHLLDMVEDSEVIGRKKLNKIGDALARFGYDRNMVKARYKYYTENKEFHYCNIILYRIPQTF